MSQFYWDLIFEGMVKPVPESIARLDALFSWRCRQDPQALAYGFVRSDLELGEQVTYEVLDEKVGLLAGKLRRHYSSGSRVLLLFQPGLDVVCAFWASVLAGLIPVPAPCPDPLRLKNSLPQLRSIVVDAMAALVLTNQSNTAVMQELRNETEQPCDYKTLDEISALDVSFGPHTPPTSPLVYLQYTSGSTAAPRGVMISHGNVLAQCAGILATMGIDSGSRSLCWLPYFHDYGLVHGIIAPLYVGIPGFVMSPVTFLRRPLRWIEAIDRFGISHSGAPNFAYDACVTAVKKQAGWTADLRQWSVASCGAEPIHAGTIDRFCEAFTPHGFRRRAFVPAYGLAESTLIVSNLAHDEDPSFLSVSAAALERDHVQLIDGDAEGVRTLVGCGTPLPYTQVKIVNPATRVECSPGTVGEIWVSGPSVAEGYWNRPADTKETFAVSLENNRDDGYLRTGDLGVVFNGQIFITGRLKDLIIVNGRNLYPNDLEMAVDACHPALRSGGCAAFSLVTQSGERLVIVQEVERLQEGQADAIAAAIRVALAERCEVGVWAVILVRSGSIPRTSSGKVQRHACRKAYVEHRLAVVAASLADEESTGDQDRRHRSSGSGSHVELALIGFVAEYAGLSPRHINPEKSIIDFGLDSLKVSLLKNRIEEEFGVECSFAQLFGHATIRTLAEWIHESTSSQSAAAWKSTANGASPTSTLSPSQKRIWFLEEMHPGSALNHISLAIALKGPFDNTIFSNTLKEIVRRHEMLQSEFVMDGPQARRRVTKEVDVSIRHRLSVGAMVSDDSEELKTWMREETLVPFDLSKAPLLRISVLERSHDDHVLLITVHRLIADGWALRLLARELTAIYNAGGSADQLALRPPGRYEEYTAWQERWESEKSSDQLAYWKRQLLDLPPPVQLPADRPRPRVRSFLGGARSRILPQDIERALGNVCRQQGVTPFMVIYATFVAWLQRCARTNDVIVGSVTANRRLRQWEHTFGYFANTVALRMDLGTVTTPEHLWRRARQVVIEAYDHQDVPLERVLETLDLQRKGMSATPFHTMIVWEDDPLPDLDLRGISARHLPVRDLAVEFDLTLLIVKGAEGLEFVMLYDKALFDGSTVDRMLKQLETLLTAMLNDPTAPLTRLPMLGEEEKQLVLDGWNRTTAELPWTTSIPQIVEASMERKQGKVAVVCGEGRLTYGNLLSQAALLAKRIKEITQGDNVLVGLCVERSLESLVGLFGILKAGAAYVPLDAHAPEPRQRLIVQDAGVDVIVTQRHLRSQSPIERHKVIELEDVRDASSESMGKVPWSDIELDNLAYVIYTSGSTGRPKGVEISHRSLLSSLAARLQYYDKPVDRCLLTFPLAFDGSITGIFWTLLHGGSLIIPTEDHHRDPQHLAGLIARHQISHAVFVPSLYDMLLRDVPPTWLQSLRVVVTAGEPLPLEVVHRHYERLPETELYNEYGPTEGTVWTTVYRTNGTEQGSRVPIGKPISNARVYLLDHEMQPVPIGVAGELYIGGAGVARGYHKDEALTHAKFMTDPFVSGARMYRTGDLGLFRRDGNIEFIGREDDQVKIRGYRIELGEVEAMLRSFPGVREAAVVVQDDPTKGRLLVAFVTKDRTAGAIDKTAGSPSGHLQELLGRRLPSYMVPAAVIILDVMPLLQNGKVDRDALRRQTIDTDPHGVLTIRPRDQIEQSLIELWSDTLGRKTVDLDENFFAMGGHSLLATQLVSRIREVFRVELPLRVLFDTPTISGVAEQIRLEQRRLGSQPPLPPITPVSRTSSLPLSYSQQRMWFIQQLAPDATAYNLLFVSRQRGLLKIPVLRQVIDLLSRRHEAFRTTFRMTGAGLVQHISPWQTPHLVEIDLRRLSKEQREVEARRLAEEEGSRPFDLERGPLARISVVRLDQDDHILVLNIHHIVGDQWSFGILGRDFAAFYNALCQDLPIPESPLPVQYADYASWQRRCLTEEALKGQEQYWLDKLADLPLLYLPTDFPRPAMQTFRGAYCAIDLPQRLIDDLKSFSSQRLATSFMTMLACFQLLLSRYCGQADVAVGSPIANRTQMAMEQLIGTFVNILVLRLDVSGNPTFSELVERVKHTALGAFANQDYPFDHLVDTLQVARDPSMPPLIQVLFNMVNAPIGDIQLYGLKWEPFEVDPGSSQFDLSLTVELEVAKKAYLTFNTDLFTRNTAERFLGHFVTLLHHALANPSARLANIPVLGETERAQLLEEWNRTFSGFPRTQCFSELFEAQVQRTPDAIAVSMEGELATYRSLNARANQLARALRKMGVSPKTVVGLCVDRSIEMVVALIAILKAGGTYVPLDPSYPRERVRFMIDDSGAAVVVTTSTLAEQWSGHTSRLFLIDRQKEALQQEEDHDLPPAATVQDLAYILYTSGSTGQPKGVQIRHQSLVNFLWSMKREPGCSSADLLLSVTTLSFDIASLELYLPLMVGGRVEIASRAATISGRNLIRCMETVKPTLMQATPATWRLLLDAGWSGSTSLTALCGGEALPPDLAKQLCARTKALWNMYGPTETTVWSTIDRIQPDDEDICIGRPIANTQVYVLDSQLQPVPIGVWGELFIGGEGLAKGYHRRPDLTADRFIRHPFSGDPHARLYRTGDLVRYREDGKLVHMGRVDHQVKIRGFRIELGEVESVLARHPKLKEVVVVARDDQQRFKQLVAYVVRREGVTTEPEELRAYVRSVLPDYMVPSFFVFLEQLPLTANKKVDRSALPAPDLALPGRELARISPRTGLEIQLMTLWQQVLGVEEIGIHDNFFDLGGHSLKAAQLFFQLEMVFGKQLPLATLFQAPTIAELAEVLVRANWTPPWQSLVAIQPSGSAPPLFLVSGVGGNVLVFAKLAKLLGMEQPVYGLQARGLDGKEAPFTSVIDMAAHYVREIRQVQSQGPYWIAGICTGGLIAYEMAQQLAADGIKATVFMLDTWHPDSYARYKNRLFGRVFMISIVLTKIATDLRTIVHQPMAEWWVHFVRKGKVLLSLFSQSITDHVQDKDFQVQRLTQATFLAVAHYRVKRLAGRIINVVASRRQVGDMIPDTRQRWAQLANEESWTIHIPAEDSGRLFVSPYVEELAASFQQYLPLDYTMIRRTDPQSSGSRQA